MSNQLCPCATNYEWTPEQYGLEHHPDCTEIDTLEIVTYIGVPPISFVGDANHLTLFSPSAPLPISDRLRDRARRFFDKYAPQFSENGFALDMLANQFQEVAYEQRQEDARLAEAPYGDAVQATAGDEPRAVGQKIADAIRSSPAR